MRFPYFEGGDFESAIEFRHILIHFRKLTKKGITLCEIVRKWLKI